MNWLEVLIVILGVVLAVVGVYSIIRLQLEGGELNVIKIGWPPFQVEFRLQQSTLIFVVGTALLVTPLVVHQFDRDKPATATSESASLQTQSSSTFQDPVSYPVADAAAHDEGGKLDFVVEPNIADNTVGNKESIYVTLREWNGFPIVNEPVFMEIVEGPHAGMNIELITDERGQVVFEYRGQERGTDSIRVWTKAKSFQDAPSGGTWEVIKNWF